MNAVLQLFSDKAREALHGRKFDIPADRKKSVARYVCADGMCVVGVLLNVDYPNWWERETAKAQDLEHYTPAGGTAAWFLAREKGITGEKAIGALSDAIHDLIALNDGGYLKTAEQVEALFGESS